MRKVPPAGWRLGNTFLFRNFPEQCGREDLWRAFRGVGTVEDVFIPNKRDKMGCCFGFVSISGGGSKEEVLARLNRLWIGSYIIRAFVPRHERDARKVEHRDVRVNRSEETRKGFPGIARRAFGGGSFAEAVRGGSRAGEGRQVGDSVGVEVLQFQSDQGDRGWISGAFVGQLRDHFPWSEFGEELRSECASILKINTMGAGLVLIRSDSERSTKEALAGMEEWTEFWFSWSREWTPADVCKSREVWTRWLGVPLQAWTGRFFEAACAQVGRLVKLHKNTGQKERLDVAWVFVSTGLGKIDQTLECDIDGSRFQIRVEECCDHLPGKALEDGGESDSDQELHESGEGESEEDEHSILGFERPMAAEEEGEQSVEGGWKSEGRDARVSLGEEIEGGLHGKLGERWMAR
ncbi:hypothetical protein OROHE_024680 [Orobanche hederae]